MTVALACGTGFAAHPVKRRRAVRAPVRSPVSDPSDVEARLAARMEEVAADAAAAHHLAAAGDRDPADLAVKVDADRQAVNALGVQTAGRFDRLEHKVDTGFAEVRGRLDQAAAGHQRIVDLLTTLIDRGDA